MGYNRYSSSDGLHLIRLYGPSQVIGTGDENIFMPDFYLWVGVERILHIALPGQIHATNIFTMNTSKLGKLWECLHFSPICPYLVFSVYWECKVNSLPWEGGRLLGCSSARRTRPLESVSQIRADRARSILDRFLCYSALSQPRLQCTVCTHGNTALWLAAREQCLLLIGRPGVNRDCDWSAARDPGSGWIIH